MLDTTNENNAEENLDSENNEEILEDEEDFVEEEESEEGADESVDTDTEDPEKEAKKQRKQSTIDRLKEDKRKLAEELEKYKGKPKPKEVSSDSEAVLARLENRGVMDKEEQEYVLRFAKVEGISPIEALSDDVVKDKLAFFKKKREQSGSTQTPGNRTGVASKSVDYYINKNEIPKDPVMAEKVQNELSRRAKAGA